MVLLLLRNILLQERFYQMRVFVPDFNLGKVQPRNFADIRLLNKPYENEVTMRGQNPPLKYYQPLPFLTHFERGFDKVCQ